MTTLATETWTGADGAAWPAQWTTGTTGAGAAATIQANRGRLASGAQGGYSGDSRISRRLNITAPTDVDVSGTWTPDASEPYGSVAVRANNLVDTGDGYYLRLNKSGLLDLVVSSGYAESTLGTFSFAASSNTTYGFRLRAVGSLIQARVWSGTEPATWDVSVTDTGVTGSGAVGFTVACGAATTAHAIDFDDVLVTNGDTAVAAITSTVAVTPAATVSSSSVTLASESWTGADGAAWPAQWVAGQTGAGAAATIQANRGRLASGAQGAYLGASRISRRLNITAPVDVDISGTWRPDATEPYGNVAVRADNAIDYGSGYYLLLNKSGTLAVERVTGFTATRLGTFSFAAASNTTYGFRLRAVGSSIKARVWAGTEPTSWQVDVTDTGVTGSGAVGLSVVAGAATTAHAIDFDDVLVTTGEEGPTGTVAVAAAVTANAVTSRTAQVSMTSTALMGGSAGTQWFGDVTITTDTSVTASATAIPRLFTALRVWILFGDTWTEVTRSVVGPVTIRQGRATEFDDVGPGVLSFTLRNVDGEFMPENTDSPYHPWIREDRPVYVVAERGPQSWVRFRGYIKSIEPSFPAASAHQSIVKFTAVDALGLCAARKVQSSWVLGGAYHAKINGTRYDAIVLGGDGPAQSYFDNVTTSPGPKARATVGLWADFRGPISSGNADGLSIEGSVIFGPSTDGNGSWVEVETPNVVRCLQFWLRVPPEAQLDVTRDRANVLTLDAANTTIMYLRLKLNGATQHDLNVYSTSDVLLGTVASSVTSGRWVRVTLATNTANPTTTDIYYDGGGMVGGGFLNVPVDLRAASSLAFGGLGGLVAKMEIAGIALAGNEAAIIPAANGMIDAAAGDIANRMASWSHVVPGGIAPAAGSATTDQTRTGSWHGRTALEIGQEIARSARGVIWVDPGSDWQPRLFARDVCYPADHLVVVDSEGDLAGQPHLLRAVDSRPTRITCEFPGGRATVIDAEAEAAASAFSSSDPQARTTTVSTIVADRDTAEAIAAEILTRGGLGMRITEAVIDLEQSATDLVPKLFDATQPNSGLFPTQRLRIMVPASHFGPPGYKDVYVQGWEEVYDAAGAGSSIKLDLSPAHPPPGPLSAVATVGATASVWATVVGGTGGGGGGGGATGALALAQFGAPLSGKSWHSGSWTSVMAANRATQWGTWRGSPNDFATVYPAYATWAEMQASTWVTDLLAGFAGKLNYGLPMLPTNRPGQWGDITSGANDAVFLAIANDLASKGWAGKTYVRVGIEVNGTWFANGITWATIPQFKAAFIRIVNLFRSVSTSFKFGIDWSAGAAVPGTPGGTTPGQVFDAVNPGDQYWDCLGIDTYDHWDLKVSNESTWQNHLRPSSGNAGIGHALDWVRTKAGKGLVIPEWGCATYAEGSGDNPYYITRMHEFFTAATDRLVLECYFNEPFANVLNSMWNEFGDPRQCPNAGVEYRRLWATTGTPPPPPPPPPTSTTYPAKTVSVYKMMWSVNGPNIGSISTGVNCVRIAFAQGDPPALVGWGAQGQASFLSEMATMRARGVRFIISVGGSGGALNPANRTAFLSGIANIRSQLGGVLDGLDWDIEASAMNTADTLYLSQQLKAAYGSNFAITFVPNGGNVGQYLPAAVACQNAGVLDEYGQQFYDAVVSVGEAAGRIQEAINAGIPISKISVGMMIGSEAIYWDNNEARANMQTLMAQFPGLQRAYLWEAARAGTTQWVTDMRSLIGN